MEPIIIYDGGATFTRKCQKCGRFVKPYKSVRVNDIKGLHQGPNATCRKCGRTRMPFWGFL